MTGEDQIEPQGMTQVPDQQDARHSQEGQRQAGAGPPAQRAAPRNPPGQQQDQRHQEAPGGQAFRPGVQADPPAPGGVVRDVVGQQRRGAGGRPPRVPGGDVAGTGFLLRRPCVETAVRLPGGQRVQGRLMRALVVHARPGALLRAADRHRLTVDDLGHRRARVVQVTDHDRSGRAHGHARRLQAYFQPVRAQVALLRRVVLGIDEDRIVRAGRDAGLAADADRLVKIDDAVLAAVHRPVGHAAHAWASAHWLHRVTWNARLHLREDAYLD